MRIFDQLLAEGLRNQARRIFRKYSLPRWVVFMIDSSGVFFTFIFSYYLRFNFDTGAVDLSLAFRQSLFVVGIYCCFEIIFRAYAGLIRHTTIRDIFVVFVTSTASLSFLLILTIISRRTGEIQILNIPLSIILIHYLTINAYLFSTRIMIKMFYEMVSMKPTNKKNVVIFGAGDMGVIVKRVIGSDTENPYHIIAFLDNNRTLQGKNLNGIPVFAPRMLTREFLDRFRIETMIFAIKNIPASEKADIFKFAVDLGLEVLEVPAVHDWLNGQFQLSQLKKIKVQDLLTRDQIQLNMKNISEGLKDKTILVTGAAGSIGSEIVRQLTRFPVRKMILVDNAETPMFHLESELEEHYGFAPVRTILADITDKTKMDRIFRECNPQIVYHAAAYKHVSMMEENPHEAIRVNVGGTMVMTRLAIKFGISKFVMVSTDKAVNPTNVMGASKRICELIVRAKSITAKDCTQFVITRFGNVLDSNGSVIPIFRKQIQEGGPVTVTHPEITRYFMTIPEACQLVLEAGFMGKGGEIYVFDMGEPVKIDDLARQMIKLSGLVPDKDIRIEYTGLRPGEKLYEELLANKERTIPTYNPKISIAELAQINPEEILSNILAMQFSFQEMTDTVLVSRIRAIVPEYRPANRKYTNESDGTASVKVETFPE